MDHDIPGMRWLKVQQYIDVRWHKIRKGAMGTLTFGLRMCAGLYLRNDQAASTSREAYLIGNIKVHMSF
jgi:hypothetical protein